MKKRLFLLNLVTIAMVSTMSVSFVSCDDDDDNGNNGVGNVSALTGILDQESGLRLCIIRTMVCLNLSPPRMTIWKISTPSTILQTK